MRDIVKKCKVGWEVGVKVCWLEVLEASVPVIDNSDNLLIKTRYEVEIKTKNQKTCIKTIRFAVNC